MCTAVVLKKVVENCFGRAAILAALLIFQTLRSAAGLNG
jgi:hypothetical protein